MPTYDYRCKACDHRFEEFQSVSAAPLSECPVCQGPVERLISGGTGLIFKGSGFYITDYTNKNSANGSQKTSSDTSKSTTTENKAATESGSSAKSGNSDKSASKNTASDSK